MNIRLQARDKIISAIRALKKPAARRSWAEKLGEQLYKMQKNKAGE